MTEENTQPEGAADVTPVNPDQNPVSLTLQDLTLTANIIDLAMQRGAFKAAEATTVGNAFQKLVGIIQAVQPPQPEGEAPVEDTDAPATEDTSTTEEETSEE